MNRRTLTMTNLLNLTHTTRKTMIVALARKLLIALWRFITTGETWEGVLLRPAG
jgi:hypothetical protein